MGKAAKEQLNRALNEYLNTIHETLQALNQTPSSSLEKVSWKEVIQMGEQLYKQATMVGMLWTGEAPEVKALEENMASYFNMLQGLLLLSHSSTVGAGPTLSSCIHVSIKQVVDSSFMLMKESVSSYGVARGCGWQHIGAYVNLASFYLFGIPIAASLAFWLDLRGKGLWIGILSGAALQTILLTVITCCTNWEKQAAMARERLHADEKSSVDNMLT